MNEKKRTRLEAAGWKFGDAEEFLGLSEEERELVELRFTVSRKIRALRGKQSLTQKQLANKAKSSQSRIAKVEAADPSVSLDLSFRAFFALGGRLQDLVPSARERRKRNEARTKD